MLGPNLFIVYINDIVRSLEECKIQLFANCKLEYLIGQDVAEVINTINQELETLYKWLTTISNTNHNGIFINGRRIEQVDQ